MTAASSAPGERSRVGGPGSPNGNVEEVHARVIGTTAPRFCLGAKLPSLRGGGVMSRGVVAAIALAAIHASAAGAAVLPTGRPVAPAGRISPLQAYPTGVAARPDGKTVLAIAGPVVQGGAPGGPSGGVALTVIDAVTGEVRQTLNVDDAFQGVVYDSSGTHAYVAGGAGGNVHRFRVAADGTLTQQDDLPATDFVAGLAISRDGRYLGASDPTANLIQRYDLVHGGARTALTAPSPDRLGLCADGKTP